MVYSVPGGTITETEVQEWIGKIDDMSHFEMAYLWKTAPTFPVFHSMVPIFEHFNRRFQGFGGMTSEIRLQVDEEIERLVSTSQAIDDKEINDA